MMTITVIDYTKPSTFVTFFIKHIML